MLILQCYESPTKKTPILQNSQSVTPSVAYVYCTKWKEYRGDIKSNRALSWLISN